MNWALTWEKVAFVILILGMFLGFACRRDPRKHVPIMGVSIVGLLLLFSWIVVLRFAFPHAPVEGRSAAYWTLFITHVLSGLLVILASLLQSVTGGVLWNSDAAKARAFHRRCGYFTLLMALISLISVVPL